MSQLNTLRPVIPQAFHEIPTLSDIKIESFVRFITVPVGLAGPLRVQDTADTNDEFFAPLATVEPTLVASCSRGCKAFNMCGGIRFHIFKQGMTRAPAFAFKSPFEAIRIAERILEFEAQFAADAEQTSRHARLRRITPHVIGSQVHVKFEYFCGGAVGQDFVIEGETASDKKASWGNVMEPRGVQVLAWGELSDSVCNNVFGRS
ncbi:hydroxymethylglutaryl-coenzyme A reductase-domain-containing protein [Phaeosphaeriaceae sp. PMI808]|nr:hydroxymethylglutaryl-coenzyme A reductase-domain-containing protein [Phaeosphaeriaceae sp. PMI808]